MLPSISALVLLLGPALTNALNVRGVWKHNGCVKLADMPFDLATPMPESKDRTSRCQATCQSFKYAAISEGTCHCGNTLGEQSGSCEGVDDVLFAKMYVLARTLPAIDAHSDAYAPAPTETLPCGAPVVSAAETSSECPGYPEIPDLTPTGEPPETLPPWQAPSPTETLIIGAEPSSPPPGDEYLPPVDTLSLPCLSDETTLIVSVTRTSTRTSTISCPDPDFSGCLAKTDSSSAPPTVIPPPLTSTSLPMDEAGESTTLTLHEVPSSVVVSEVPEDTASVTEGAEGATPSGEEPPTETAGGGKSRHDASVVAVLVAVVFSALMF